MRVGVVFDEHTKKIHDIGVSVLFGAIDAEVGVDAVGEFVDVYVFGVGDESDVVVVG